MVSWRHPASAPPASTLAAGKLVAERETALARRAADQATKAAGREAKKAGFKLSGEALKAIREQVYGVAGT